MGLQEQKIAVISHACIREVNRSVYRYLKNTVASLHLIIPSKIRLKSNSDLLAEPAVAGDPEIVPMELVGTNPRTYHYPELNTWLNGNKPTIVILENDPVSKLGFQLTRWCKENNAKIICQTYENTKRDPVSTLRHQGLKDIPKNLAIYLLNYWSSFRVDSIFVVNRESEAIFSRYGYKNVTRIPLGYDKGIFFKDTTGSRNAYRSRLNAAADTIVVAYFGRLIKEKGVDTLIMALRELRDLKWVLLLDHVHDNESSYTIAIKKLIRESGIEERVIYFEADHIEIANYMRAADVMAAPSITTANFKEQYGRTVQEAMACGCVALVSDSGHLKDLVGDSRLVFREHDVQQLKGLLLKVMTDEGWREQVKDSLSKRAGSHLTSEVQAEMISNVIGKLI